MTEGGIAASGDGLRRLRATLAMYLDEPLSPSRTARRLGIHAWRSGAVIASLARSLAPPAVVTVTSRPT